MSGQPCKTPRDAEKFRKAYLASLDVQIANNEKNLQANLLHKRTGQLTTQITDYRTTSQKLADATMLRIDVRKQLRRICDAPNTEQIISSLSDDEIRFVSQNLERIIKELQPKFRYGVDAPHFLVYIQQLIMADERVGVGGGIVRARELGIAELPRLIRQLHTFINASVRSVVKNVFNEKLEMLKRVMLEIGRILPILDRADDPIEAQRVLDAMSRATNDMISSNDIYNTLDKAGRLANDQQALVETLEEGVFDKIDVRNLQAILAGLAELNEQIADRIAGVRDLRGIFGDIEEEEEKEDELYWGEPLPPPAPPVESSSEEEEEETKEETRAQETKGETKGERAEEPPPFTPPKGKRGEIVIFTDEQLSKKYTKDFISNFKKFDAKQRSRGSDSNIYDKEYEDYIRTQYPTVTDEQLKEMKNQPHLLREFYKVFRPELNKIEGSVGIPVPQFESRQDFAEAGSPAAAVAAPDLVEVYDIDEVDGKTTDELLISLDNLRLRGLKFMKLREFLASEGVDDLDAAERDETNIRRYYGWVMNYLDSRGELTGNVRFGGSGLKRGKVKSKGYGFGGNEGGSSSLGGKTPARSLHQPNAPPSRYTDMGGSGVKKKKKIRGRGIGVVEGVGVHKKVIFAPFGRFFINLVKLNDDILCFSRKKGTNIPSLKTFRASQALAQVIRKMVNNGTPSFNELSALSRQDKEKYNDILRQCHIVSGEGLEVPKIDEKTDLNQFEIMKGEILSGNDSTELIKKFKVMIIKLIHNGRLPKSEGKSLLMDLAELGY